MTKGAEGPPHRPQGSRVGGILDLRLPPTRAPRDSALSDGLYGGPEAFNLCRHFLFAHRYRIFPLSDTTTCIER